MSIEWETLNFNRYNTLKMSSPIFLIINSNKIRKNKKWYFMETHPGYWT